MSSEKAASRFPSSLLCTLLVIALTIGCLTDGVASAESRIGIVTLEPSKTLVEFQLVGALHTVHGKFQLKSGTIKADSATGKAEGAIVIDAASGDSGDVLRDHRMNDSVLEVQSYPEITFMPRHLDGHLDAAGAFNAKLEGLLKLHGGDHDITIDTQGTLVGDNLIATARFTVPYVAWGLEDPSLLMLTVAKQVDIAIATAGHVTWLKNATLSQHPVIRP